MTVHHIHPHVMSHHNHRNNKFHFSDHNDIFKNLDHVFQDSNQGSENRSHSFTATYSNQNGHVTKHFTQDGRNVGSDQAQTIMDQMHHEMHNMDRMFSGLGLGASPHPLRNLDHVIDDGQSRHSNFFKRLTNHFKK